MTADRGLVVRIECIDHATPTLRHIRRDLWWMQHRRSVRGLLWWLASFGLALVAMHFLDYWP